MPCRCAAGQPKNQPNKRGLHAVSQNQAEHLFAPGSKRDANAYLVGALGNEIGENAQQPGSSENQRQKPRTQLLTSR